MNINLTVKAEIIDIKVDQPQKYDIFLVDTNVWFWQTYSNASFSNQNNLRRTRQKILEYTTYLDLAHSNGSTLVYFGLVLAELAHNIEKTELKIYNRRNRTDLDNKAFRHSLPEERLKVVAEVKSAWSQVESMAQSISLPINDDTTNAALTRFQSQALDGYDLLFLEAISGAEPGQVKIITDDMDYAVVPDIQVFTSNGLAIQSADDQNRLLTR